MRRTLVISEEFGLWRAETSAGAHSTGGSLAIALDNLLVSAGVSEGLREAAHQGGRVADVFDLALPKQEGRPDVPASTVR